MKVRQEKLIKMQDGKICYLTVYHIDNNKMVIGCEYRDYPIMVRRPEIDSTLHKWYKEYFPDDLKELFKEEDLTILCAENLSRALPSFIQRTHERDRYLDIADEHPHFAFMDYLWIRNEGTGSFNTAPVYNGRMGMFQSVSVNNTDSSFIVIPIFWIEKKIERNK